MKTRYCLLLTLLTLLIATGSSNAQTVISRSVNPDQSVFMPEIGAIASGEEGEAISFTTVMPVQVRPEPNRNVDVREGDTVMMMNGVRVRSIATLRELYEGLGAGSEVKLALGRGDERLLVKFAKDDPEAGGRRVQMHVVNVDGHGEADMELVHELNVLLGEQEGQLQVAAVIMPGELEAQDNVIKVNGQALSTLAEFREVYSSLDLGATLELQVRRGEEMITTSATKAERPAGMMIRKQ